MSNLPDSIQQKIRNYRVGQELKKAESHFYDTRYLNKRSDVFGKEVVAYWQNHLGVRINPAWHYIYANYTGVEDVRFVPVEVWFSYIHDELNQPIFYYPTFGDKNFIDLIFDRSVLPKTVFKCIRGSFYDEENRPITKKEALCRYTADEIDKVSKPSMSSYGDRVLLIQICNKTIYANRELRTTEQINKLLGDNYIVQYRVKQHKDLEKVYPHSLNTYRVNTLRLNGRIIELLSTMKFGAGGKINDNHNDAFYCSINKNGEFNNNGCTRKCEPIILHPETQVPFQSVGRVPSYKSIRELTKTLHSKIPHLDYASWDIAIDHKGNPIVIEVNSKTNITVTQLLCNKPFFEDYTEELLAFTKERRAREIL